MKELERDRRNDVGGKIVTGVMIALLTFLLTLFFSKTYDIAEKGYAMGFENSRDVAVLQANQKTIIKGIECISVKLDSLMYKDK